MKRALTTLLVFVLLVLFYELYQLYSYHGELSKTFSALSAKLADFKKESLDLQADLDYFKEPENLVKELRSRFNYKKPGEKLIIVVPSKDNN